jgi:2-(3-amino-3-carboxypropyl)histidine synthase
LYNLELERVKDAIIQYKAQRVLLQLPDGLRPRAYQIVNALKESTGARFFLSGDSCYGSCDLALSQGKELNVDLIVHYGHSGIDQNHEIPTLYIHAEIDIDIESLIEEATPIISEWQNVGVVTTIQHIHQLDEIAEKLRSKGKIVKVGKGSSKIPYDGQILGCGYSTALEVRDDVDGYLYIGGGQFHPRGLILSAGKPVVIANPYSGTVTKMTPNDLMGLAKKRLAQITFAKSSKLIGILVSSKPGQAALSIAEELESKFNEKGYSTSIIYLDEIRPEHLNNYSEFDAFIVTACPRIAIDGIQGIDRPMLTIKEARVVLNEVKWEEIWGNRYLD